MMSCMIEKMDVKFFQIFILSFKYFDRLLYNFLIVSYTIFLTKTIELYEKLNKYLGKNPEFDPKNDTNSLCLIHWRFIN